ncbi:hypothetical protein I4U23_009054 [Adineta vaga]|nr:hypothetical protein I4U23_009054 [Adineta vaga]
MYRTIRQVYVQKPKLSQYTSQIIPVHTEQDYKRISIDRSEILSEQASKNFASHHLILH